MADQLYIDTSGFKGGRKALEQLFKKLPDKVSDVLNASADEIVAKAKRNAPADRGLTRQSISANISQQLKKHITCNAPYAAYMEFGTGKYAAQYVATLPATYKTYAAQFKGKGGGNFRDFIRLLTEWVRRKGITGTYSVKTHKRTGNKATQQNQNQQAAYAIAISILTNGVHPHPFMIPALIQQTPILIRDLETMLKQLRA